MCRDLGVSRKPERNQAQKQISREGYASINLRFTCVIGRSLGCDSQCLYFSLSVSALVLIVIPGRPEGEAET